MLRLYQHLIVLAEASGKALGKSISQLLADDSAACVAQAVPTAPEDLPPGVRSLLGALRGSQLSIEDHRRHVADKYLKRAPRVRSAFVTHPAASTDHT